MRFLNSRALDVFKTAFLIVASIVGAGFASGKELSVYFAVYGPAAYPAAAFCGILIFLTAFVIIDSTSVIKPQSIEDYNKALFGKLSPVADIIILFNFFIVSAAMIAAVDSLFSFYGLNFPVFSIATCFLCYFAIIGGTKRLLNISFILVPFLIAVMVAVSVGGAINFENATSATPVTNPFLLVYNCVNYVCFNIMLSSGVILSNKLPADRQVKGAALSGGIIAALMVVLMIGISACGKSALCSDMPFMVLAGAVNMSVLAGVVIWLGIFTSLMASALALDNWTKGLIKNKYISAAAVMVAAYLAGRIGFSAIVEIMYPISGVFGIIFILAASRYSLRKAKSSEGSLTRQRMNFLARGKNL